MIYKSIKCCCILFFVFCNLLNAKGIDLGKIEQEIIRNNREGNHKVSQKKLSDYLLVGDLTKEEKANLLFYMAATYRSVNDYVMCLDYLNKSNAIAQDLPKDNLLRMKLDYEYAFVYFDYSQYEKSQEIMDHIVAQNYKNAHPEDNSYILMQQGYLFLKDKKLDQAEIKYNEALKIMSEVNPCNVPMVLSKMMVLYGMRKDVKKSESLYAESMKIAEDCNVLKYKIHSASEMEKIYKQNGQLDKAYVIGAMLDTLRRKDNLEAKVAEMHMMDKVYEEKVQMKEEESGLLGVIVILIFIVAGSVLIVVNFYRKSKNLKKDNRKIGKELELANQELNSYSQSIAGFNGDSTNNSVRFPFDSDKLTDRQKDLLDLMAEGLSNKEMAERLFITESTVKYHIKNIYSLLGIRDRKDFFKKMKDK